MMSLLYVKVIKILPKINIVYRFTYNQTKYNIWVTQTKLQYNTGVTMQDNAKEQWCYNTILEANTILNTAKLTKMIHQVFCLRWW